MSKFNRLAKENRVLIGYLLNKRNSYRKIASELHVSVSTISNEIKLGKSKPYSSIINGKDDRKCIYFNKDEWWVYNPYNADRVAKIRKSNAGRKCKLLYDNNLLTQVIKLLKRGRKPDVIAGILNDKAGKTIICKETIFYYIYNVAPSLTKYLKHKKRKKRSKRLKYNQNKERKNINERCPKANNRAEIGHFEADLIISKNNEQKHILTLTDRKTRMSFASYVYSKNAWEICKRTMFLVQTQIGIKKIKSITYDNGTEFALNEVIETQLNCKTYFANPYHSWERGTNERHNGLIRTFFPKKSSFLNRTDNELNHALEYWNNMERKILNYKTPNDLWKKEAFP